ncbi:MAG: hypothetical protein D6731_06975 [Planctomycetota bacterium]|nr:MAG: hypothetical protein D6731_06975 [Planctomycetota bacterium]
MRVREGIRWASGWLLLAGAFAAGIPLAGGWLDVAWLRLAGPVEARPELPEAEVGSAPAPFEVVQRSLDGALRWRLTGAGLHPGSAPLEHLVDAPRLRWVGARATLEVHARRGRARLPRADGPVRLVLEGGVEASLRPRSAGEDAPGRVLTLSCPRAQLLSADDEAEGRPLVICDEGLVLTLQEGGARVARLEATALRAHLDPVEGTLRGPVRAEGAFGLLEALALEAKALRFGPADPEAEATWDVLDLDLERPRFLRVSLRGQEWTGTARALDVRLGLEDGARSEDEDSEGEAGEGARGEGEGGGSSAGEERPQGAALARRLRALTCEGLRLAERGGPGRLRAARLSWRAAEGAAGELRARSFSALVRGVEDGRRAAPWEAQAERVLVRLRRWPEKGAPWDEALERLDAEGSVRVARRAERPRGRLALLADALRWAKGVAKAEGRPVTLRLGPDELTARSLRYERAREALDAVDPCYRARWRRAGPEGEGFVEVRAPRGRAVVSADPAAWRAHRTRRREVRRAGGRGWLLPAPLAALHLEGAGARRVQLRGSAGIRGEGDAFDYAYAAGHARLSASAGAEPARLSGEGVRVAARLLELRRVGGPSARASARADEPSRRWALRAEGSVAASAVLPARDRGAALPSGASARSLRADRLRARAGWLEASVRERAGDPPLALEGAEAGGPEGVVLGLLPPAPPTAQGAAAEGSGPLAAPAPLARLEAPGLRLREERGVEPAPFGLEVDAPWEAALRFSSRGPARLSGAGPLSVALVVEELRALRWGAEVPSADRVARVLRRLSSAGGLTLRGPDLGLRADRVRYDRTRGAFVVEGSPAEVRRQGVLQRANRQVLRLAEE